MSAPRGSATQAIKARLNIADIVRRYVTLRRVGNRWVAPCPFHQETKPSFSVNEEEGFFHCFGCQASGDLFDFYARINGLEFRDALEQLAEEAGVRLDERAPDGATAKTAQTRRTALKMYELASGYYARNLAGQDGAQCREYLEKRRLTQETIESFALGWSSTEWKGLADTLRRSGFSQDEAVAIGLLSASDRGSPYDRFRGRLMFPIRSLSGQTIAFGGRIIAPDEDAAKYINSSDSLLYKKGDNLYGLFQARRTISAKKSVMLTEGYMDVLTLHQFGYTNACGVLGTALTAEQVKRLANFCSDLELLFDGDGAGRKAALRGVEMAMTKGLRCRVVLMPDGEDIDSILQNRGPEAFEALRAGALDGLDFCIRALSGGSPRDAVEWVKNFLRQVEQPELLSPYVSKLARGLDLDELELRRNLPVGGHAPTPAQASAPARPGALKLEGLLLDYLVRNPGSLPKLRDHGAELVLSHPFARTLWAAVAAAAPEFSADMIFGNLADKGKEFWIKHRMAGPSGGDIANKEPEKAEQELSDICARLDAIGLERQGKACLQALRQTSSGEDYDVALLNALQEAVRRKHGKH